MNETLYLKFVLASTKYFWVVLESKSKYIWVFSNVLESKSKYVFAECLAASLVYQATVERGDNSSKDTYVGLTEGPFKTRFNSHKYSFSNQAQRNATALSKHVWSLKDSETPYKITWRILARARPYSPISKRCNLCTTEKYYIICHPNFSTLNNRNELASSCRHRRKFLLKHASIT